MILSVDLFYFFVRQADPRFFVVTRAHHSAYTCIIQLKSSCIIPWVSRARTPAVPPPRFSFFLAGAELTYAGALSGAAPLSGLLWTLPHVQ